MAPQASDQQRAESLANRVYDEAKRGADFGDLVRRYSTYKGPAGPGGNLGFLPLSAFPQEFRDGLSALSVGQVSRPLLGPQGYNIFKMLDRHSERPYTVDEVKEQLPDLVRQIKLKKQYDGWVAALRSRSSPRPFAKPSRHVGWTSVQPSSRFAFAFDAPRASVIIETTCSPATSRPSHSGT